MADVQQLFDILEIVRQSGIVPALGAVAGQIDRVLHVADAGGRVGRAPHELHKQRRQLPGTRQRQLQVVRGHVEHRPLGGSCAHGRIGPQKVSQFQ